MIMKPLTEFCTFNMGQSPDSKTHNDHGKGLPFYQGNADFGEIHPETRVWCSAPVKIAEADDILISVRAPIGAMNIAAERCCIGRGLAALTPIGEKCSQKFLYYALQSKVDSLIAQGTGSTFKAISKKVLETTLIPAYNIHEQEQISTTIAHVDSAIAARRSQIVLLDQLVKSRFIELFGDVISNSKNWPIHMLAEIAASRLGKMLDAKQQTGENNYPYLANFNVQWFRFELDSLNQMDFNEDDRTEFELRDGDLLICEGGEIGRCAVWHDELQPCYFQKALHRVRCDRQFVHPDYLAWWFKYNCDHNGFAAIAGAKATIAHLTGVKLKQLQVALPPIELQEQFAGFVEQTDKSKLCGEMEVAA